MWVIAGLGNPGPEYAATRHNIGFMAIDRLAGSAGFSKKFQAECASLTLGSESCLLVKPQTFMNRSGQSVQAALAFYKLPPSQLIVLHDDLDLPLGKLRVKRGGGAGGHNGLRDIDAAIGPDYWRIRLGIGHPGEKHRVHDYVLSRFAAEELPPLHHLLEAFGAAFPLFWQRTPEIFASSVAQALQPPKPAKPATDLP